MQEIMVSELDKRRRNSSNSKETDYFSVVNSVQDEDSQNFETLTPLLQARVTYVGCRLQRKRCNSNKNFIFNSGQSRQPVKLWVYTNVR